MHTLAAPARRFYDSCMTGTGGLAPRAEDGAGDEALYRRYVERRDEDALERIIRRHWPRLHRIAWRILRDPQAAEDAAQRALLKLASGRGWRGEGPLEAWLAQVAVNEARMSLRAARRRDARELRAGGRPPAGGGGGGSGGGGGGREGDLLAALEAEVERLPDELREPLLLRYAEGLTHEEVARALGLAPGTASSRLRRGLERLRESLAAAGCAAAVPDLEALLAKLPAGPAAPAAPSAAAIRAAAESAVGVPGALGALKVVAAAVALAAALAGGAWLVSGTRAPAPAAPPPAVALAPAAPSATEEARPGQTQFLVASDAPSRAKGPQTQFPIASGDPSGAIPLPSGGGPSGPAGGAEPAAAPSDAEAEESAVLLEGRVLSARDGAPVVGGEIRMDFWVVEESSGLHTEREARSEADGTFRIRAGSGVALGPDGRVAWYDGRRCTHFGIAIRKDGMAPILTPLAAKEVEARRPLVFRMEAGGESFAVRAIDRRTRAPLAGVPLRIAQRHGGLDSMQPELLVAVTTGPDGVVRVSGLGRGEARVEYSTDHAEDDRFGARSAHFDIPRATSEPVEFDLDAAAHVEIEVVDLSGAPAPRFEAWLRSADGEETMVEGLGGRASFSGLDPVEGYHVGTRGRGQSEPVYGGEPFGLAPGERKSIRLVVPAGEEAPAAAAPESATAAHAERRAPEAEAREPGVEARLAGWLVDRDGRPIAGARVRFVGVRLPEGGLKPEELRGPIPKEMMIAPAEVRTDAEGRFAIDGVPGSRLLGELRGEADGFAPGGIGFLPHPADLGALPLPPLPPDVTIIRPGEPTDRLTLRLERGAAAGVTLALPPGAPPERLPLLVGAEARSRGRRDRGFGRVEARVTPLDDGRVRIDVAGLEPGTPAAIALRVAGNGGLIVRDLVAGGPFPDVALPAAPAPALRGRLVLPDGNPAKGARIGIAFVEHDTFSLWSATADDDGWFSIEDPPSGRLTIEANLFADEEERVLRCRRVLSIDTADGGELGEIRLETP